MDAEKSILSTTDVKYLTRDELEAGLAYIRQSPKESSVLDLIVRRPRTNERDLPDQGELDMDVGLVGDYWRTEGSPRNPNWAAYADTQLTIMNSRAIALVAQAKERWPLAGDQLYIDLDLSAENLPPGTQLSIGSAVVEVTAQPHTGCKKFVERFGMDAMMFVNSDEGKQLHLRGIYTKVVQAGVIRVGDGVKKVSGK